MTGVAGPFGAPEAPTLLLNAGSTSVKISWAGDVDGGRATPSTESLDDVLAGFRVPSLVVHRVVHGGERHDAAVLDDAVVAELRDLTELAPLHQPPALNAIDRCRARWPEATQVACFDTAFHATLGPEARTYALPQRLRDKVRVYGFHGLSHQWSSRQVARAAPEARRVLVAHLGGGQSLCGVLDGRSVVTTMGFTPLDGLVMATRSGTLDPGALLWLAEHTDEDLGTVLERESGLAGLAGTADMKQVVERSDAGDADAHLALQVWLHRFVREAGGCVAVMGGLDALAFTGGVGEHSDRVRAMVADRLAWLGVRLLPDDVAEDPEPSRDPSEAGAVDLSPSGARVRTFVVPAREDLQMLTEAARLRRPRS